MRRCYSETEEVFKNYGARGIYVCERWHSVRNFIHDMAPAWREGLTIDRIDNDGPYDPGNCRWATVKQQNLNRRDKLIIEWRGETRSLQDWAEHQGIPYLSLYKRIYRRNWSVEKAMTTPNRTRP